MRMSLVFFFARLQLYLIELLPQGITATSCLHPSSIYPLSMIYNCNYFYWTSTFINTMTEMSPLSYIFYDVTDDRKTYDRVFR